MLSAFGSHPHISRKLPYVLACSPSIVAPTPCGALLSLHRRHLIWFMLRFSYTACSFSLHMPHKPRQRQLEHAWVKHKEPGSRMVCSYVDNGPAAEYSPCELQMAIGIANGRGNPQTAFITRNVIRRREKGLRTMA